VCARHQLSTKSALTIGGHLTLCGQFPAGLLTIRVGGHVATYGVRGELRVGLRNAFVVVSRKSELIWIR
jgi:hypothetical protein